MPRTISSVTARVVQCALVLQALNNELAELALGALPEVQAASAIVGGISDVVCRNPGVLPVSMHQQTDLGSNLGHVTHPHHKQLVLRVSAFVAVRWPRSFPQRCARVRVTSASNVTLKKNAPNPKCLMITKSEP